MTQQNRYLVAAAIGAVAGLAVIQHSVLSVTAAGIAVVLLIVTLSQMRLWYSAALALCCLLGFACTNLTVALIAS